MTKEKGNISLLMDRAMTALAKYGYLTVDQMQRLKVGVIRKVRPEINKLIEWKYVGVMKYTATDLLKHPYWYFLTPKGANFLANTSQEEIQIRHPKSLHDIPKRDYLHRVNFIDTWIAYDEWIAKNDFETTFFHTYFDFLGSNRNQSINGMSRSVTKIELSDGTPIVPDGVFAFNRQGKNRMYLLEVSRGDDTKRIIQKIEKICQSIEEGAAATRYQKQIRERGLFTFEDEGIMKATMTRVLNDVNIYKKGMEDVLFFAMAKDVIQDFSQWIKLTGESVELSNI